MEPKIVFGTVHSADTELLWTERACSNQGLRNGIVFLKHNYIPGIGYYWYVCGTPATFAAAGLIGTEEPMRIFEVPDWALKLLAE